MSVQARSNVTKSSGSPSGGTIVHGPDATGSPSTEPPVQVAGVDGTGDIRTLLTDASGRQVVVGAAATGAAPAGDPVAIAGIDTGGNIAPLKTVAGHIQSISEQLQGQPLSAYGTIVVGMDPSASALPFLVDAAGNLYSSVINRATYWAESTTPLAASATFNGTAREAGPASPGPSPYAYFTGFFYTDQTGTARIESSPDNVTWTPVATDAVAASTPLTLQVPITARYYRAVIENGATLQGSLVVNSGFQAG